jgi:hypothetical protein
VDQKLRNRIEAKLAEPNEQGCREWRGALNSNGLGVISKDGKVQQARRVVYEEYVKPISGKLFVRPRCGNVLCCTPEHLYECIVANEGALNSGKFNEQQYQYKIGDSPSLTISTGETKTLHEWLADPRVTAKAAVIRSRLRDMAERDAHNERWKDHPDFEKGFSRRNIWGFKTQNWTIDTALFTPKRKKITQWEI